MHALTAMKTCFCFDYSLRLVTTGEGRIVMNITSCSLFAVKKKDSAVNAAQQCMETQNMGVTNVF